MLSIGGRDGRSTEPVISGLGSCRPSRGYAGQRDGFDEIETDVRQLCGRFNVVSAGYDPWQSAQMSQRLRAEGVPMHEFRATTQKFSPAIIELDAAMRAGGLRHDGNQVLTWCIGNVVGKADRRGNLYPTKSRPDQKIDAAVALMMAVGRAMVEDEQAKGLDGFLANPIFGWHAGRTTMDARPIALRSAVRPLPPL